MDEHGDVTFCGRDATFLVSHWSGDDRQDVVDVAEFSGGIVTFKKRDAANLVVWDDIADAVLPRQDDVWSIFTLACIASVEKFSLAPRQETSCCGGKANNCAS